MRTESITSQIIARIEEFNSEDIFVAMDFVDLADINTVWQVLMRQEKCGNIQRVLRGVYYRPAYNFLLQEHEAPSPHQVALALARKYGWTIAPSGNTALNQLGLSTQVTAKWSYVSDGPYNDFEVGNVKLEFKHCSNKVISRLSYKTVTVIQALKALGKEHIDDKVIEKLKKTLSVEEKELLRTEAKQSTAWIYSYIRKICTEGD